METKDRDEIVRSLCNMAETAIVENAQAMVDDLERQADFMTDEEKNPGIQLNMIFCIRPGIGGSYDVEMKEMSWPIRIRRSVKPELRTNVGGLQLKLPFDGETDETKKMEHEIVMADAPMGGDDSIPPEMSMDSYCTFQGRWHDLYGMAEQEGKNIYVVFRHNCKAACWSYKRAGWGPVKSIPNVSLFVKSAEAGGIVVVTTMNDNATERWDLTEESMAKLRENQWKYDSMLG
jgi:hypothetical protein